MSENIVPIDGESQKKRVVRPFICAGDLIYYIVLTSG
jgi:hypothetical protein